MRSVPVISPQIGPEPQQEAEVDLLQLLGILWRGKWAILFWAILGVVPAWYYANRMATPVYSATTQIVLMNQQEQIVDVTSPLSAFSFDYFTLQTEVETLMARELAEKVVEKLDLEADPDFNLYLRQPEPGLIGGLIAPVIEIVRGPSEPARAPTAQEVRDLSVDMVLGSLRIANVRESYVFNITAMSTDPRKAALLADTVAELHIENQIAVKYQATERAAIWLTERVGQLKSDLDGAENAVKAFNTETDLVGTEALAALNRQLKDFRNRIGDLDGDVTRLATRVTALGEAEATGDLQVMAATSNDAGLEGLALRLSDEGAPELFRQRFGQVLERARFELERARSQKSAVEGQIADLEQRVAAQSTDLLALEQLQREAEAIRQLYESFLGRLKEVSVQQGIHRADSRILSAAVQPGRPTSPRKTMILGLGLVLGVVAGTILVLLRELRQTGFRSSEDLERATGQTVFAQVPKAPIAARRRLLRYLVTKPTSALVESIRNLRTSVMLSNIDAQPQIIMLTSSLPGEGKTTLSLGLTQSFASMGRRVLLIEGDIRRRAFQEYFKIRGHAGIVTAVAGTRPLDEIVHHSEELGADVLVGEKTTVNAADFFSSARFAEFMTALREYYDIIIIDTPPVLVVPDARVIGQMADAVVYAVHWNQTTRAQVSAGLQSLSTVDVKVSGLALSQIDIKKAQSYGGKYGELYNAYGSKYYGS